MLLSRDFTDYMDGNDTHSRGFWIRAILHFAIGSIGGLYGWSCAEARFQHVMSERRRKAGSLFQATSDRMLASYQSPQKSS
jgi:hypothetical protein